MTKTEEKEIRITLFEREVAVRVVPKNLDELGEILRLVLAAAHETFEAQLRAGRAGQAPSPALPDPALAEVRDTVAEIRDTLLRPRSRVVVRDEQGRISGVKEFVD